MSTDELLMSTDELLEGMRRRALIELVSLYRTYLWDATYAHEAGEARDAWTQIMAERGARASRERCRGITWIISGRYPQRFAFRAPE